MLGISDNNERRRRKLSQDWPPHLRIGKKVYYRKSVVENYLRELEQLSDGTTSDADSGSIDVVDPEAAAETPSGCARCHAGASGHER